ncbi:unnamed protein product [Closterium sp. Naga37s-1]|nr:unnamed protein product [Closterium sp. Naga37s-1]
MACIGAESACVDVDALFASCWEQNDSLTRFFCSMIAAPRLAVSSWIRPCEQAAAEVQSVPVLPVVALLEEAVSADTESVHHSTEAGKADAATVTAAVPSEEAEEIKKPLELKKKVSSFLELLAQEGSLASPTVKAVASSAKVAAWLGVESGSEQGGKVGAEASSGWCSLSRSESSCSSHSACLIHLSSDSSSCSSSAHSLCSSPTGLTEEVAGVKRGIGRGVSSIGKGCSLSTAYHFTELLAAEKKSVKSRIGKGPFCSGKDWSMEVKGFGKAEQGQTVSNLLYGYDDEEEEEEDGSSRERSKISGTGTMCYMNQLYMDEEEEEEREALAASGISVGIGRFGARRRITGSSSRVTLSRMSGALRQY